VNLQSPAERPKPRFIEPGIPVFDPGTERYFVRGGGAVILRLLPDDELTIVDLEGRQRCELALFAPDGRPDPAALGLRDEATSCGIERLLLGSETKRAMSPRAARHGKSGIEQVAVPLPGDVRRRARFLSCRTRGDLHRARAGRTDGSGIRTQTDLLAIVRRARPAAGQARCRRHGRDRCQYRIDRFTAQSYEVKASTSAHRRRRAAMQFPRIQCATAAAGRRAGSTSPRRGRS
jgi:hypothetical protein